MIPISNLLLHYKRPEIQKEIVRTAENKEAVGSYGGEGYAKRPDVLQYGSDVLELVKKGITSFHISEELWTNPLRLTLDAEKRELESLKKGWDLILDIDCKELDYSKIAAHHLIQALKHHGIKAISCKFSGNHGFHIAIPYESFPLVMNGHETRLLFPEAPRRIALYLKELTRKNISDDLLKKENPKRIAERAQKEIEKVNGKAGFDPFAVLDIDTILISPRHLCRSVYSFNEKSGLVSIPIDPEKVLYFNKTDADFRKVKVNHDFRFLDREKSTRGEAERLFVQAFDYSLPKDLLEKEQDDIKKAIRDAKGTKFEDFKEKIPEQLFPPCINNMLKGMKDGRKRSMFILINFLTSAGWDYESIEDIMKKWNEKNEEALREVLIKGHIRYHKQNRKLVLPPNCDNKGYYQDLHFCQPDGICKKVKNPVNYSKRKAFMMRKMKERGEIEVKDPVSGATIGKRRILSEEQKAMIKKTREDHKKFKEDVKKRKESGEQENGPVDPYDYL